MTITAMKKRVIQIWICILSAVLYAGPQPADLSIIPDDIQLVLTQFRQALRDSQWQRALSLCTENVRSKAVPYDSPQAFFEAVVPLDQITALTDLKSRERAGFDGSWYRFSFEIPLTSPDWEYPLEWKLAAVRQDSGWTIEFPTKPLPIWLKHAVLISKTINDRHHIDPRQAREGFDVRLIPLSNAFVLGQPIPLRLEIENTSNETLGYTRTSYMVNDPLEVKDPNGRPVPYLDSSYQTMIGVDFVEPGEMVVLVERYDLYSQYHITKPGRYTIQFKKEIYLRPSNLLEIDIQPGPLASVETVIETLKPVLPPGWSLTRSRLRDRPHLNLESSPGFNIYLVGKRGKKATPDPGIFIHLYVDPPPSYIDRFAREAEFLGDSPLGPVYLAAHEAETLWPDYRQQIAAALAIQLPPAM